MDRMYIYTYINIGYNLDRIYVVNFQAGVRSTQTDPWTGLITPPSQFSPSTVAVCW